MGTRSTLTGFLAVLLLMVTVPAGARENDYNDFGGGGGGGGGGKKPPAAAAAKPKPKPKKKKAGNQSMLSFFGKK